MWILLISAYLLLVYVQYSTLMHLTVRYSFPFTMHAYGTCWRKVLLLNFDKVCVVCGKNLWKKYATTLAVYQHSLKSFLLKHTTLFVSTSFHICTIYLIQCFHFLNQQWLIEWNQSVSSVSGIMYSKCIQKETEALRLSTRYRHVLQTKWFGNIITVLFLFSPWDQFPKLPSILQSCLSTEWRISLL